MIDKLLIVDDHAPTRQWLRMSLSDIAHEICESMDGSEAVEKYAEIQPDWVLMDLEMKPMNGLIATRLIRERFPGARILMVTSHDAATLREAAMAAGAIYFLSKEDLLQVRQVLRAPR
jgi:two-component system, chemotaxis family, chemotaxis protein CheY